MTKTILKISSLSLSLVGGILLILLSITGCSDGRFGSMLTADDVDKYTISNGGGELCILNGFDSSCMTLLPPGSGGTVLTNAPVIHIHPEKLIYIFYWEGKAILRAERIMDTALIVEEVVKTQRLQPRYAGGSPGTGGTQGKSGNTGNTGGTNNGGDNPPSSSPPQTPVPNNPPQQPPQQPPQNNNPGDGNNGGTNNDGGNTDGGNTGGTNDDNSGGNNGLNPNPDSSPDPNAPIVEDITDSSHLYYYYDEDNNLILLGWLVWIYYPSNYKGPNVTPENTFDPTFEANGFRISQLEDTEVVSISQTATSCGDWGNPCNSLLDPNKSSEYSVQMRLATSQETMTFLVEWDQKAENWEGSPPPNTQYTLDASMNMMNYVNPSGGLGHTTQDETE